LSHECRCRIPVKKETLALYFGIANNIRRLAGCGNSLLESVLI
jgi:hypothetical protein